MKNIEFKSKVYVPENKNQKYVYIAANVVVIGLTVYYLFSILFDGANLMNISGMIVVITVSFLFKKSIHSGGSYVFSMAEMKFSDTDVQVTYKDMDRSLKFNYREITEIDYSSTLQCLRFLGNCCVNAKGSETSQNTEQLVYISEDEGKDVFSILQEKTGLSIGFRK